MLQKNDFLPDFTALNQEGKEVHSKDFLGKKLIVFFYPKANTPGCTAEACNLSDNYLELQSKGYNIIGISADSVAKQNKFSEKYEFPFSLLADENKDIIHAFGVWGKKKFMGREYDGILRTTFIFNENGKVDHVITDVKTKDHTTQILNLFSLSNQ